MEQYLQQARTLIEALPYIRKFNQCVVVIKYGGSAMNDPHRQESIIQDIALMKLVGMKPVVVHGGGNAITSMLSRLGKESTFVKGLRVTDKETAEIAEMVLSGYINKHLVQSIQNHGISAVGINGKDGNTLEASKKLIDGEDVGFVGSVTKVNLSLLNSLIEHDFIPVIAPVGTDRDGNTYNINADYAAASIAGALQAEKLFFLTDVEGILQDVENPDSILRRLTVAEAQHHISSGVISGGMIPKTHCCIQGIQEGVKTVHILDGRIEHSMLLEVYTDKGIGTMITP